VPKNRKCQNSEIHTCKQTAHILDFLKVTNLFDDVGNLLISFFLGRSHNALGIFFIITELQEPARKDINIDALKA